MSATFNPLLLTDVDYIRFRLADTDVPTGAVIQDETYLRLIEDFGMPLALVEGCRYIRQFYANDISSFGEYNGIRFAYLDRYKSYTDLLDRLEAMELKDSVGDFGLSIGQIDRGMKDTLPWRRSVLVPPPEV